MIDGDIPLQLCQLVNQILESSQRLREICLDIDAANAIELFDEASVYILPEVERVTVSADCHNLLAKCPNASTVKLANAWRHATPKEIMEVNFLQAALALKSVTELQVHPAWSCEMIDCKKCTSSCSV